MYVKLGVCRELKVILISIRRIEITILYICSTLTLAFYMYRIYRISNNYIPLTDKTFPKRNNRLKSEMTTLGLTCRLLGFIKMGDFSPC